MMSHHRPDPLPPGATTWGNASGRILGLHQPFGDGSVLPVFKGTRESQEAFTPYGTPGGRGGGYRVKHGFIGAIPLLASPAFASRPPPSRLG
ncbi:hypothetical protein G7Z17_g9436 [Cylindrodendrum hubeiense]|uniref:Uncharacterized protein n=1 Tax=Cylindrodendrum hubeiense TaxID=595255 RepID=A0A9P5H4K9_9HYPO|nr:hypothetical protein G7Z17_g9436 [Cylindrodendrum hubeiense]